MEQKDRGSLDERSRSGFSDRRRSCSRFVSLEGGHRIVGPLEIVDLHDPLGLVHDESAVHLVALEEVQQSQEAQRDELFQR